MKKLFWSLFVVAVVWKLLGTGGSVELGPGVMARGEPLQQSISNATKISQGNYLITPLATFEIKAKVLSKKEYTFGRESDLSPVDFALGWQNMSDESVLNQVDISQSGRWYHWHVKKFPIPRREIETQSANMHIIPANKLVEEMIDQVKQGQIISMTGKLVRVDTRDGWSWQSSMTRNDTGAHACEVIYVEQLSILKSKN